jgi:uncharacterized protein
MQEQGGRNGDLARGILEDLRAMPVIDTHEHLPWAEDQREKATDVLKEYLSHYMSSDIVSAGMTPADLDRVRDHTRPLPERWRLVEPFWEACRYTGYGRALDASVRSIYGIDGIRGGTLEALNAAFLASMAPGHYKRVLKDICGIRVSILDGFVGGASCDRDFFRRVWQPHYAVPQPRASEMILATEKEHSTAIKTLSDWMEAFDRDLEEMLAQGIIALKSTTAYSRSLLFRNVPFPAARAAFSESLHGWRARGRKAGDDFSFPVEAQDFMMHHMLKRANEMHLVFQFHTGLQEGNGNTISNSDPSLMSNLFLAYPDVDFDLFHISYPYQGVAATLAKNFRNVFVDMCWAHIISPAASRAALSDFLDVLPFTKISAFGGDYMFVDGICGHLAIARENIAHTLAEKVGEGIFPPARAAEIGRALFYDNPLRIFRLRKELEG